MKNPRHKGRKGHKRIRTGFLKFYAVVSLVSFVSSHGLRDSSISGNRRILLFGIDTVRLDRLLDDRCVNFTLAHERAERRDDDVAVIDFEEVTQRRAALAAAEAVGAERHERTREPPVDRVGQRL